MIDTDETDYHRFFAGINEDNSEYHLKKGEVFTKENIWVKRPGTGEILAKDYTKILGKKAVEDIAADTQLKNDMVE